MLREVLEHPILLSLAILVFAYLLKLSGRKVARIRAAKKAKDTRHVSHSIRHLVNVITVLLLLLVWSSEIQNFALSIAAFAVAIVLATREFIQSIIGFFYLVSTRPFRVGDWVQVDGIHGEVGEIDWLKTSLLEIDMTTYQVTPQTIFIPNSKLVTSIVKNLNFMKRYVTHDFHIVRKGDLNAFSFYDELVALAKGHCEEFNDVAARYNAIIERKLDATISGPDPQILFSTTDIGDFKVRVKLFCPTDKAIELEHQITADFMRLWDEQLLKLDKPKPVE